VPTVKIRAVPAWRDSDEFTDLERLVLEYAEAMTDTLPGVTDEMVERLGRELSEAELVKLTAIVAAENLRSPMNAALGADRAGVQGPMRNPSRGRGHRPCRVCWLITPGSGLRTDWWW